MGARTQAKMNGSPKYFTGIPCARGHVGERYTTTGNCVTCMSEDGKLKYDREQKVQATRSWKLKNPSKRREYTLRQYGLTPEGFQELIQKQQGNCAACGEPLADPRKTHVDHCHKTGKVRGVLCLRCNTALGLLDDSPEKAERLAEYLRGFL